MMRLMLAGLMVAAGASFLAMAGRPVGADEGSKGDRVFEIRTYHCVPGRLPALNKRFQEHTVGLFKKHGIESIAYWTPLDEKDGRADTLIYVLAYPSREAAAKSWEAFRSDPDWKKAQAESEKDGKIVAKVDSVYLTPTRRTPLPTPRTPPMASARPTAGAALEPVAAAAIPVDGAAIRAAASRLEPWIHRTPVLSSRTLDEITGGSVVLKCENFQKVGAFKIRGATNALLQLPEAARRVGVVTHSSGNHAQALAQAGRWLGVPVTVVMPRTAPAPKRRATEGYGARVVLCEPTLAAREGAVAALVAAEGLTLIHPFDDWDVIAGQATAALELIEQAGPLDLVMCPVGGGGLLAGTALATRAFAPGARVVGAEPKAADDALRSLVSGTIEPSGDPKTVADGLRTSLGARGFAVIRRHVDAIVTATEPEILAAMRFVWERFKIIIEPSCAVPVAPLLERQLDIRGLRVGVIITGGNVDLEPFFAGLAEKWL